MNVEIVAEAALFPEKEYINGIFVAVWMWKVERMSTGWRTYLAAVQYHASSASATWTAGPVKHFQLPPPTPDFPYHHLY